MSRHILRRTARAGVMLALWGPLFVGLGVVLGLGLAAFEALASLDEG